MKNSSKRNKFSKTVSANQKLLDEFLVRKLKPTVNDKNDENNSSAANQNSGRRLVVSVEKLTSSELDLHLGGIKTEKGHFCDVCYVKHETAEELELCLQKHWEALKDDSDVESTDPEADSDDDESGEPGTDDEDTDAVVEVKKEEPDSDCLGEPASDSDDHRENGTDAWLQRAYICDFCGVKRINRQLFLEHLRFHLYGHYICGHCGSKSTHKKSLHFHMKTKHGALFSNFVSKDCGIKFTRERLSKHSTKRKIFCVICTKKFWDENGLKKHMKKFHPIYTCTVCSESFPTSHKLSKHKAKNHPSISDTKCDICSQVFINPQGLKKHLKAEHLKEVRNFHCTLCSQKFYEKKILRDHLTNVHCEERFACSRCSKKFKTNAKLNEHTKIFHPTNPELQCRKCRKEFKNKETLKEHVDKCLKETFKCSKCPKTFTRRENVYRHVKVHDKTYQCRKCKETFDAPGAVRQHMAVHSKTAVKCEICLQVLISERVLVEHTQRLHNVNLPPLTCDYCGLKLKTKRNLLNHFSGVHKLQFPKIGSFCFESV